MEVQMLQKTWCILTPGHGEPQGLLAFVVTQNLRSTEIDQLKQLITKLTQAIWFPGSESIADLKEKPQTTDTDSVALQVQD